jgi:hypothetical protein
MLKIGFTDAQVQVRVHWRTHGSVLKDTVKVDCTGIELDLDIVSDEPADRIARLVKTARDGCYAESVISAPISATAKLTLNGHMVEVDTSPTFGQTVSDSA